MANKKYIVNGKVYEETAARKVIVAGRILEETTAGAPPAGGNVQPIFVNYYTQLLAGHT